MIYRHILIIFISLSLFPFSAMGKPLKIAAAYLPANMDRDGRGREAELVKSILSCANIDVNFDVQPYSRHFVSYEKISTYDAVMTVPQNKKLIGYPTQSHILYQNGISYIPSLQKHKLESLTDLKGRRVISFVGARNLIPKLNDSVGTMESYEELSRQDLHSKLLFDNKVDAVISDGLIFSAHNDIIRETYPKNKKYKLTPKFTASFPANPFVVYFKDKKIRDSFDKCLLKLRKKGITKKIETKYLSPHKETLGNQYPIQ